MDHAIRRRRAALQAVQILQRSVMNFGARGFECLGASLGAGEAKDLMACADYSRTRADPMKPVAPVTKTRMRCLQV
jgi:hypothetical protein